MKIIEVKDTATIKEFLLLPVRLYKEEENWIRPLDKDIEFVFDPNQNKKFRHGECTRWILQNDEGLTIGRIAAFIDNKLKNKDNKQPTGGCGFFECIDDEAAAFLLFDTAKSWLQEREIEAMDGPINFGERHQWWGLLIEGFTEPNHCMPYNFKYYKAFFEAYGFQEYFQQYTFGRQINNGLLSEKTSKKAERVITNPRYTFEHIQKKNIAKYTEDFRTIYNQAWTKHGGAVEMKPIQAKAMMKQLKPIMDERVIWFGYYDGEPIAFFIMIPEVNQLFKYLNGKFGWFQKLLFMYHKLTGKCTKLLGLVFGITPAHQGKGVESAIIVHAAEETKKSDFNYTSLEMNWIGDFNPKMIKVCEAVDTHVYKTHITYRKLFDESKPFERMKIIG